MIAVLLVLQLLLSYFIYGLRMANVALAKGQNEEAEDLLEKSAQLGLREAHLKLGSLRAKSGDKGEGPRVLFNCCQEG